MALLDHEVIADELPQSDNMYEPLPAGWYTATVASAELRDTKAGNGQYIAVRYDITGPTHQGRVVWGNLNIRNPNPTAEQIGRQQLGELMRAIGLARVNDTDQLIGGSLSIKLAIRRDERYGDSNDVKGYKATGGGSVPSPAAPAAAQQAAPAAPSKPAPPWAKK